MVWYPHIFKNFPQFVMIHRGFGIVNEIEVDVFLEFLSFLYDPENVDNLISGSSSFSKPNLDIWKLLVHIMLKPSMKILSMSLVAWEMVTVAAADAAKSLQLCLTLCDPIDSSPPGSPIPGILQARTLEWVAIVFSSAESEK